MSFRMFNRKSGGPDIEKADSVLSEDALSKHTALSNRRGENIRIEGDEVEITPKGGKGSNTKTSNTERERSFCDDDVELDESSSSSSESESSSSSSSSDEDEEETEEQLARRRLRSKKKAEEMKALRTTYICYFAFGILIGAGCIALTIIGFEQSWGYQAPRGYVLAPAAPSGIQLAPSNMYAPAAPSGWVVKPSVLAKRYEDLIENEDESEDESDEQGIEVTVTSPKPLPQPTLPPTSPPMLSPTLPPQDDTSGSGDAENDDFSGSAIVSEGSKVWTQLGEDLKGGITNDNSWSVSYSKDGTTIAVAPSASTDDDEQQNNKNNKNKGGNTDVQVYRFSDTQGGWVPLGSTLKLTEDENVAKNLMGFSVSLSRNGNVVAIGAYSKKKNEVGIVKTYAFLGDDWLQIGSDNVLVDDNDAYDNTLQLSLNLSNDATTLAIGAPNHDNGRGIVRIYDWSQESSDWVLLERALTGTSEGDLFGTAVSLTNDGQYIAIGAPGSNNGIGLVEVHKFESGRWIQYGADVTGEEEGTGKVVEITSSEKGELILGVSALSDDGKSMGRVRVFNWAGFFWFASNNDGIQPPNNDHMFGTSISLTSNGSIIAISSPGYDGDNNDKAVNVGRIYLYRYNSGMKGWELYMEEESTDLTGQDDNQLFGWNVDLSSDGSQIAVSFLDSSTYNGKDPSAFITRVYKIS